MDHCISWLDAYTVVLLIRQTINFSDFFSIQIDSYVNNNLEKPSNRLTSSSSEEDNSPTQMNNCRKFIDKAPLVKRLSNSLLRPSDEYRPLLNGNNFSTTNNYLSSSTAQIASKNDINTDDMLCDANEMIASKFGDSCRIKFGSKFGESLTSVLLDNRRPNKSEFDFKQNFLRETSSGKCPFLRISSVHFGKGTSCRELFSF